MESLKEISDWADKVISIWNSKGIMLEKGVSVEEISELERLLDFRFPKDFVQLYTKANGFKALDWDENMFSFWPLDRILEEYQKDGDTNYIGFCDFLINSHSIGFFKTDEGIFKSYDQIQPIGNTFKEGIELIISNSDLIY